MPSCVVYTRPDRGVSIFTPSLTALAYMTGAGGRWDGFPSGFLDRQVEAQGANGVGEYAARRFVDAMQRGGLTETEALEVLRDRFCAPFGTGCEIWDVADLPQDKTHRNAWRRSPNGGPIWVDEDEAQRIDEARLWRAYATRS